MNTNCIQLPDCRLRVSLSFLVLIQHTVDHFYLLVACYIDYYKACHK